MEASTLKLRPAVLVADNYQPLLLAVELVLRDHARVATTRSHQQARQLASGQRFSAILLDIRLGGGVSGIDVANDIRRGRMNCGAPIIFISGTKPRKEEMQRVIGASCHFLLKPFEASTLLKAVLPLLAVEIR